MGRSHATASANPRVSGPRRRRLPAVALAIAALLPAPDAAAQAPSLTAAPHIARAYDAIFDARFDDVPELLDAICAGPERRLEARRAAADRGRSTPPAGGERAPGEVCRLLEAVSLWGRMQLDPHDTSRDAAFAAAVNGAIGAVEAWTRREPARAEAWFYLGAAYGARAQWRVLRGERLAAARDGKRIKEALERALALDPALQDAYFGIGLYRYYADVAPAAARMLRWLLLLPGGDRTRGLEEMLRARELGQLLRSEADYQLHLIYLWYERQPQRALDLLQGLDAAHPHNPRFLQLIAEVQDAYFHDAPASLGTWTRLLERALAGTVAEPAMSAAQARLGMALQLDRLFETDVAVTQLRAVLDSNPAAPAGAAALAQLQLGQALDRLGFRDDAVTAYRAALASAPAGDPLDVRGRARAGLRRRPDPEAALAYRLSLEGWRALERGALGDAGRSLSSAFALRPEDPVVRYRLARVRDAAGDEAAALDLLEQVIGAGAAAPPAFYAAALLDAGRIYERQRAVARAIELYGRARAVEGAYERTTTAAAHALARISPPALRPSR
jgi:tetratricopeptide (TPR) repeat protein